VIREIAASYLGESTSYYTISAIDTGASTDLSYFDYLVPGLIVYALLILIPGIAQDFTGITEKQYIFRYFTSKTQSWQLLFGTGIYQFSLVFIQLILAYLTAYFFGFRTEANLLLAFVVAIPTGIFVVALGLLIGGLIKKMDTATNVGTMLSIVLGFFSGSFIVGIGQVLEFELFGTVLQFNDILPSKWASEALEIILINNGSLSDITNALLIILISEFNVNIFLQAHAGAPVRVDRQGRTVTLHKPALTFGLAVQPGVLSDLATGSKARFRGNGLLARFLYCLPTSTVGSRNVSDHRRISEQVKAAYYSGIDTLLNIPTLYDEQGRERARILTLSPDAKSSWIQFSQYIESKLGIEGDLHSVKDWASKLPGAALRVAGLFYVVEHGGTSSVISAETMERSLDLCDLLISHAKAAFDLMGDDEVTGDAKAIFKWIVDRRLETFTQREALKRHEGRLHRVDRLKKALAELTDRYIISEPDRVSTGRRPSVIYKVNPKIYEGEVL